MSRLVNALFAHFRDSMALFFHPSRIIRARKVAQPSNIPPRLGEIRDKSSAHWVASRRQDDWNSAGCLLRSKRRERPPRHNDVPLEIAELPREFGETLGLLVRIPLF